MAVADQSQPGVYFTWPTIFSLVPKALPPVLPPPVTEHTFRSPFGIDKDLYNAALRPELPVTFAAVYILSVFALNSYNRNRKNKPWAISKQRWFNYFIVVHNLLLAAYSFATFAAMFHAIAHTLPSWDAENWRANTADALCKVHGPRGLGDAATFNTTINIWEAKNTAIHLGYDGNPDATDVGRLWNEGLAFWGWLFYVSKFYEVLDTLIILAKGKRSATLQTYHHAGAMLCMWAGIRYMSPPIWMFVFINSAIHAMMYTYFTLSALGVKVPTALKRTLTSLQIAQFVFGASYAALHLFIQYDIPVTTPYQVISYAQQAASSASSVASSITARALAASSTASKIVETPSVVTASATYANYIKKLLLRAAGEEGVAERVGMHRDSQNPLVAIAPAMEAKVSQYVEQIEHRYETRYRTDWTRVNCVDTTGEAFAILLNLLYLSPLTGLFIRFFVKAYGARGRKGSVQEIARSASDAAKEAKERAEESFEQVGEKTEDEMQKQAQEVGESERYQQLKKDVSAMKNGTFRDRRVSERVQSFEGKVRSQLDKAKEEGKKVLNGGSGNGSGSGSPRRGSPSKQGGQGGQETPKSSAQSGGEGESAVDDESGEKQQDVSEDKGTGQQKAETDKSQDTGSQGQQAAKSAAPKDAESGGRKKSKAGGQKVDEPKGREDAASEDQKDAEPKEQMPDAPEFQADDESSTSASGSNKLPGKSPGGRSGKSEGENASAESKEKQEENIDDSAAVRPGVEEDENDPPRGVEAKDDTDAMGQSGVDVGGYEDDEVAKDKQGDENNPETFT